MADEGKKKSPKVQIQVSKPKVENKNKTSPLKRKKKSKVPTKSPLRAGTVAKQSKPAKLKHKESGCICVKHLPNGFDEAEIREFFEQFGEIIRVCVVRSKRTQQSKGFGYILFRFYDVAQIAAKAVDNYMLFGRILKTKMLPKRIKTIPRNFDLGFESKKDFAEAQKQWLQEKVQETNAHVGNRRLRERRMIHLRKLQKAIEELGKVGVELPEMKECVAILEKQTKDLEDVKLFAMETKPSTEQPANDDDDSDVAVESKLTLDSNENDESYKQAAIKKASLQSKKLLSSKSDKKAAASQDDKVAKSIDKTVSKSKKSKLIPQKNKKELNTSQTKKAKSAKAVKKGSKL
ncbi:MKI67 FHA domain-interacting nucleolar phosphoprotein-like [Anopheles nili]|uniref:MKI67 FHA domain-interacting nucleolar phosphoprotein-like n=1 Tax=Anopheles nili TaxID=185578 RepID=UPI00237B9D51|nr:MKI67 FHA domain-interacting nucleolar phosphoprotein-like [Anopheles nili]